MSRRVAGPGSLLLAGLLLGSLALAAPATGQQSDRLQVKLRDSEAAAGRLKVTVAMSGPAWTGERLDQGDFTATIDGQPVQGLKATPLQEQQGSSGQLAVFLAVDTSGSMLQNDNIGTARRAAANFASQMRSGTRMGVISFANDPKVVQLPTDSTGQVGGAIQALKVEDPQGDTALYDAVVLASRQLAGQPGQRNLFVLSDGRHEGTPTTLGQAIAAAKKAKVKVFTVGLEVPGRPQDQAALAKLAEGTGGDTVPTSVEDLEALLSALGRNLASQYVVDLPLPPSLGSEVDFRLRVRATGGVGEYHNDRFFIPQQAGPATAPLPAELPRAPALSRLESDQGRYIVALCGFAAILLVLLLLFGPGPRTSRPYRALRQRLSPYSLTAAIADERTRPTAFGSSEWAGRATAMAETLVQRGNLEEAFLDRLEAAGLNMRVAEFVLISLASAFIPPLLVLILTQNLLFAALVVVLGTVGPLLWLAVLASRRQAKFDEQLPSTLQLVSGALQAGHSLQQAVDTVVHEAADPIAAEFQRVLTEARLGRPLEEAFEAMAKRTKSIDFEWTVMAIRLQRQVGGNLAEVLSTVSQTIRDRYALKRQIKALSAEGRLSSVILSVLPVLLFAGLLLLNPVFLRPLYTTTVGITMMAGAAVLMIIGVFWLKKITEIKV
ncbi:MAG: type II secretion system F family protein [Actinomycetes bacterium]